ncbi:MAG: response regulator [Deltaproteobacteria bacterium]|nr:response regulator [Deltaproteobacteria bacterium]
MDTILIVDDEKNYLVVLEALLSPEGYEIMTSDKAQEALRLIQECDIDLVLTDMKMPGMTGMELLEEAKKIKPEVPVIMMTAYGTIEMAVEAMKKRAYDYITKPFQNEELKLTIRKALENYRLIKENRRLSEALSERFGYRNIVGKSKPMLRVYDLIGKVAQSKASVLITGPSGTGKELIAKAIHYESLRKDRPFISVNCGALAETLLESELFGHEKGAFTGAIAMKKGRFELADGGSLFLDEIVGLQPESEGRCRGGCVQGRSFLPPQRDSYRGCPAPRADGGHPPARNPLYREIRGQQKNRVDPAGLGGSLHLQLAGER